MKILVTGGTGFIGSHTCVELLGSGYTVVIVDNLLNSKASVADRVATITGKLSVLPVYGNDWLTPDGTGVRDYIRVSDLAIGHKKALEKLDQAAGIVTYNLGTGRATVCWK